MTAGILTGETMEAISRNILQENHCIFLLLHTFWEVPPSYLHVPCLLALSHISLIRSWQLEGAVLMSPCSCPPALLRILLMRYYLVLPLDGLSSLMCAHTSDTHLQIATPVQAARADHLCFPHLPDVLAMCTALSDNVTDESFRSKRPKLDPKSAQEAGET